MLPSRRWFNRCATCEFGCATFRENDVEPQGRKLARRALVADEINRLETSDRARNQMVAGSQIWVRRGGESR
jgi:hypothetical protein